MQRTKELIVNGRKYYTTQYSATKGLILLTTLAKVASKPLGVIASFAGEKDVTEEEKKELIAKALGEIIMSIASQMEQEEVVTLIKDVLATTEFIQEDGKRRPLVFDTDFAGSYGHLFRLVQEIIAFQYNDFFDESPAPEEAAVAKTPRVKVRGRTL